MSGPGRQLELDDGTVVTDVQVAELPTAYIQHVEVIHGHIPGARRLVLAATAAGDLVKAQHLPVSGWRRLPGGWQHRLVNKRDPFTDNDRWSHIWACGAPRLVWQEAGR